MKSISYDRWDQSLDAALASIREDDDFPHELIRMLAGQRGERRKKVWLITENDRPVAVAPLRKVGPLTWQPVTQYILPGVIVPSAEGRAFDALSSIGTNVRIALWRTNCPIPPTNRVSTAETVTTFGIDCTEDFEAYWKSTDIWRHLRSAKNRWKDLTLKENAPGASEWIISNWAAKWGIPADETQDRLLAARYLEERGRHFSLTLFDGDTPLGGQTCLKHRGEMIGQCLFRPERDSGLGNRLLHLTFEWAREKGFTAIDIGGGHDYKRRFAPPRSERHEITLSPLLSYVSQRAYNKAPYRVRRLVSRLKSGIAKG